MIAHILATARYARVLRCRPRARAILNGPLTGLKALVDQRETAIAEILDTQTDLPEAFLVVLKARAERNGRLLLASLAGVKAGAAQTRRGTATTSPSARTRRRGRGSRWPAQGTRDLRACMAAGRACAHRLQRSAFPGSA